MRPHNNIILLLDQSQLADGGCRDTESDEYIINHLQNYNSANTTIHGDSGTIAEYDEDEVAEILHAM